MLSTERGGFNDGPGVLIFDHIYKCGGTTMYACLESAFGGLTRLDGACSWLALRDRLPRLLEEKGQVAVAGHRCWGLHTVLPEGIPCRYFTILRDPAGLARSELFYAHARGICDVDQRAVNAWMLDHGCDSMVNHIGGGDVEAAIARLDNEYVHVGLLERYDETLDALAALTGRKFRLRSIKNASPLAIRVDAEVLRAFHERGGPDYELYRHVETARRPGPAASGAEVPREDWAGEREGGKTDGGKDAGPAPVDVNEISLAGDIGGRSQDESLLVRAVREWGDRACEYLNPGHVKGPVAEAVRDVADRLAPHASPREATALNSQLCKVRMLLARSREWAGDDARIERAYRNSLGLPGADVAARYGYAIWLRQRGRAAEALEALDGLPGAAKRTSRFFREWIVTLHHAGGYGAVRDFLSADRERVRRLFPANIARAVFPDAVEALAALRGKTGLVLRSGPNLLLDDTLRALSGDRQRIDLVLQEGCGVETDGFRRVIRIPDGRLDPEEAVRRVLSAGEPGYDYALAIFSTYSGMLHSSNVFDFLDGLDCRRTYACLLDNVFLPPDEKCVFDIAGETTRDAAQESRPRQSGD